MKSSMTRDRILTGNIRKVLISLALPVILGNAIQTIYQVVDTYWVSRLADGDIAVAAINFVWPMIFVTMAFGIGMNIAGTSLISQFIGQNKEKEATMVAGQLVSFSFVFSLLLAVVGLLAGRPLMTLLGAEGLIFNYGWEYIEAIFLGMPTMFVFFAFQSIKQGQGDTVTPMILSGISVVLNIFLDPLLMFVFDMGMAGAAWATVLARAIAAVAGLYLLFFKKEGISPQFRDLRFNGKVLRDIVRIGFPAGFGQSVEGIGFMILSAFVLSFGDFTVAAFGIGNTINSLILMPAMGIGAALATVVGQNLGADQPQRAAKAVWESIRTSVTMLGIGGIAMFFIAPYVVGIFTSEPIVLQQGTYFLRLISLSIPLMGVFESFLGCFQGSGHTVMSMMMTSGRLWVLRIPLVILFKYTTSFAEKSVWYAMVLSNFLISLFGLVLFLGGRWKKRVVGDEYETDAELA
ncbi:MAG: MATE family efflux transporter [Bacillota bacterium]|jgi:putative MATE family efflux protein|nr:MATE family efflux transporter [Bacillota bacterium]